MNVPYRVPLLVGSDTLIYRLGIGAPKDLSLDVTTKVYAQITPHYDGQYVVTPTEETQVLNTNGFIMDDDVTVNPIPSQYYDTSDADIVAGDLLNGSVGYGENGKVVGNIPVNGATGGEITTKAQVINIPFGYTDGGNASISAAEQDNIDSAYILAGRSILGVSGLSANVNTSDANATTDDIAYPKTAYVNGVKITGSILDGDVLEYGNFGLSNIANVGEADYMVI